MKLGPIWITKYHLRRSLLKAMQRVDPTYRDQWTLDWASRRGWIESRDLDKWVLKK